MRRAIICSLMGLATLAGCADSRTAEDHLYSVSEEVAQARESFVERLQDEPITQRPADYDPYLVDNFRGPSAIAPGGGEPQRSVTGLERDWQPIAVDVPRGWVNHWPAYLSDEQVPLRPTVDPDGNIYETAANVSAPDEWRVTPGTYLPLVTEPLEFGLEAALLPWRFYQTPPWKTVYSGAE